MPVKARPWRERFWPKVHKTESCWLWTGCTVEGYGRFNLNGEAVPAHLMAYRELVGPIPAGLQIDHLCRNRGCVNPEHMEPVTSRVNVLRGEAFSAIKFRQTHCIHGHAFSPANTRINGTRRRCRACSNARRKAYRQRNVKIYGSRWSPGSKHFPTKLRQALEATQ